MTEQSTSRNRVAVLVDCDNTSPDMLEYALRVVEQFGKIVVRRGYGTHATLAGRWQDALVRLAFTPCLQYPYGVGKDTSNIALALDALEDSFNRRADTYCLVTSNLTIVYLCRKLRERGAAICIVGEEKTPDILRSASDQFFEYQATPPENTKLQLGKPQKWRPKTLLAAVSLLAAESSEAWVGLGALGQYMCRTDPDFSPQKYGYAGLKEMVLTYPDLQSRQDGGGHWVKRKSVSITSSDANELKV